MLIKVQNIALSGMMAQTQRIANTAHNIANAGTVGPHRNGQNDGGQPRTTTSMNAVSLHSVSLNTRLSSLPHGAGVRADTQPRIPSTVPVLQPSHPKANSNGLVALPNTSLVEEQVTALSAARAYEANAQVIKVADKLLDLTLQSLPEAGRKKDER